jgi:hypothetical protein
LNGVTISDMVENYSIAEFASAMALNEIETTRAKSLAVRAP